MSPLLPSNRDLTFPGNLDQARYELLKAIDRGGQAEQADWSRTWGEALLDRAGDAEASEEGWDFFGPSDSLVEASDEALTTADSLSAILAAKKPDLTLARQRMSALRSLITIISSKLEASES